MCELRSVVGVVVILLAAYIGTYYSIVERGGIENERRCVPSYPIFQDRRFFCRLFDPIHQIDVKIRAEYWKPQFLYFDF